MRIRKWLVVGALSAALALAGCSAGAKVKSSIGKGAPFCNELQTFSDQVQALANAADSPLATLQQEIPPIHDQLVKLQQDAPAADTVNGKSVKTDLGTVASVYGALATELLNAKSTDPNAVANALANVQAKEGQALTQATDRLDAYAKQVCNVSIAATPPTSTTLAPSGPTAPQSTTTAAPGTTTAPGSTTTATPGSTAPSTSTTAHP